ncbi:MAG: alpha/beta hydrolase [Clostridiales bacterium]|nr:alpha/beta hydrolase [Clostridiales bacterium]
MNKKELSYRSADGKTPIHAVIWSPEGPPVGILQISHGITEHIGRYEELAAACTDQGLLVCGNDHIGHGLSLSPDRPIRTYFGPKGSWDFLVKDTWALNRRIREQYPALPLCLLGFSLGSFVVRDFLTRYPSDADAAILIGTGQQSAAALAIARFVANREAAKHGYDVSTERITQLTYDTYNKKFAPNQSKFDWLLADEQAREGFLQDELRGEDFTVGAFRELLSGMQRCIDPKQVRRMNPELPILLLSGADDPVGDFGKGVARTQRFLARQGVRRVSVRLYPGLRHDVLHEAQREEIYRYLIDWILQTNRALAESTGK